MQTMNKRSINLVINLFKIHLIKHGHEKYRSFSCVYLNTSNNYVSLMTLISYLNFYSHSDIYI